MTFRHSGEPTPPDDLFFAEPPADIGPVLSAQTDAKQGQWATPGCTAILAPPFIAAIGYIVAMILTDGAASTAIAAGVGCVMLVGSFLGLRAIHPNAECSFVGRAGLAWFERRGSRSKTKAIVRFADVADVRVLRTTHTKFGHIRYHLDEWHFHDARGRLLVRLAGMNWPDDAAATARGGYWFGRRAYDAWIASRQIALAGLVAG